MYHFLHSLVADSHGLLVQASTLLGAAGVEKDPNKGGLSVDTSMVLLTWVTFFLLFAVLYKVAFKRIVAGLDQRESTIRKSLDDADRLKKELAEINAKRTSILEEAETASKAMIEDARKAAHEAAKIIEEKAREEAQIQVENATREINAARDSARATLKKESADLAVALASKLVQANLDDAKNRALIDQMISQMQGQSK